MRLFVLFNDLVKDVNFSFDQYWTLKFARLSNEDILRNYFSYSQKDINIFQEQWMSLVEDEFYLSYDKPISGMASFLDKIGKRADLYVCTARQSRWKAIRQLGELGFDTFFKKILVTEHIHTKENIIASSIENLSRKDWLIGDTGKDVETGKCLGVNTCAVLSGFMNKFNLCNYDPDMIIYDATEFNLLSI